MGGCPYKYLLGVPGQGVHAARIFGLARNDIILTILLAAATSWLGGYRFWPTLLFWVVLGEILHYVFGTPTAFLKMIGMVPSC
jgi:asparagine N-glycosylation enzyme membrane subunit Stt3